MPRLFRKTKKKAGLHPGALVHDGERRLETAQITIIDYNESTYQEKKAARIEDCFPFRDTATVTWINIDGLHQSEIIEKIGSYFGVHPLVLEDIMNTDQRPKIEDYDTHLFIVLKMLYPNSHPLETRVEQVSIILGTNYVLTFQEGPLGDVFNPVRERLKNQKMRVRKSGCDFLASALIDAIVDNYFIVLEKIGEGVETLEEQIIVNQANQQSGHLEEILRLKKEMLLVRKAVWPLREVLSTLMKEDEETLIRESTRLFFKDIYDHILRIIDTIELSREILAGVHELYLTNISNGLNEVMKVLTIFATIFMPLTFIVGIYGMNFRFMPELEWKYGYFGIMSIMGLIVLVMLIYFRRKEWL